MFESLLNKHHNLRKNNRNFREQIFHEIKDLRLQNNDLRQRIIELELAITELLVRNEKEEKPK